ncbi:unnamed protein product [Lathyrus sativus]|nr:unnamed protein product [Lathyrus sativus]
MELDIGVTHSGFTLDEYWFASDTSSGYLEDAITGWDIWCNQHNLPSKEDQLLQDHKKSSSSSENHAVKHDSPQRSCCASKESDENDASISRGQWKKIAYPFELVKPGGVEGETTIRDINHQMMMNPSKPIPHPVVVQDYESSSFINSNRSYGISGKEVAALTRIQTRGRGSITIIRTKG